MENNDNIAPATQQYALLQETTKEDRKAFVQELLQQIEDGHADALKIHLQVKSTESLIEMLTDKKKHPESAGRYCALVLSEAEKHGKKFDMHNATFLIKEAGTQYDWTVCNDDEITGLLELEKAMKANIKERQEFLKALPAQGLELIDKETGEAVTIYPPAKSSTTTVQTTLK